MGPTDLALRYGIEMDDKMSGQLQRLGTQIQQVGRALITMFSQIQQAQLSQEDNVESFNRGLYKTLHEITTFATHAETTDAIAGMWERSIAKTDIAEGIVRSLIEVSADDRAEFWRTIEELVGRPDVAKKFWKMMSDKKIVSKYWADKMMKELEDSAKSPMGRRAGQKLGESVAGAIGRVLRENWRMILGVVGLGAIAFEVFKPFADVLANVMAPLLLPLQEFFVTLGMKLRPLIIQLLPPLQDLLVRLMPVFQRAIQELIPVISKFVSNFQPLLTYLPVIAMWVVKVGVALLKWKPTTLFLTAWLVSKPILGFASILDRLVQNIFAVGGALFKLTGMIIRTGGFIGRHAATLVGFVKQYDIAYNILGPMYRSLLSVALAIGDVTKAVVLSTLNAAKWIVVQVASKAALIAQTIATVAYSVATKVAAAATWLFNAALAANPIGLVIIAIAALVAGIVLLVQHWGAVTGALRTVWTAMKSVGTWISHVFVKVLDSVKSTFGVGIAKYLLAIFFPPYWFKIIYDALGSKAFKKVIGSTVSVVSSVFSGLYNAIGSSLRFLGRLVSSSFSQIFSITKNILGSKVGKYLLAFFLPGYWFKIVYDSLGPQVFKRVLDPVAALFVSVTGRLISIFGSLGKAIGNALISAWKGVVSFLSPSKWLHAIGDFLKNLIMDVGRKLLDWFKKLGESAHKSFSEGWHNVMKTSFKETMVSTTKWTVPGMGAQLISYLYKRRKQARESGSLAVKEFSEGMVAAKPEAAKATTEVLKGISKQLPSSDAEEGPLSTLSVSGSQLVETFTRGVASARPMLLRESTSLFEDMSKTMVGPIKPKVEIAEADIARIKLPKVAVQAEKMKASDISDPVVSAIGKLGDRVEKSIENIGVKDLLFDPELTRFSRARLTIWQHQI